MEILFILVYWSEINLYDGASLYKPPYQKILKIYTAFYILHSIVDVFRLLLFKRFNKKKTLTSNKDITSSMRFIHYLISDPVGILICFISASIFNFFCHGTYFGFLGFNILYNLCCSRCCYL